MRDHDNHHFHHRGLGHVDWRRMLGRVLTHAAVLIVLAMLLLLAIVFWGV